MASEIETLERMAQQLRPVVSRGAAPYDDDALCALAVATEAVGRLVDALRVQVAGAIEERSRYELGAGSLARRSGYSRGAFLIERLTLASSAEATRRSRLGQALSNASSLPGGPAAPSRFPLLAMEFGEGTIPVHSAAEIVRCLDHSRRAASTSDLAEAESALVLKARREPVDCVSDLARALRDRLDPDGVRPREEEIRFRRGIRLGRESHGVTPISGGLDPVAAALVRAAFSEANAPGAQPRFLSELDRHEGTHTFVTETGEQIVTVRDLRSRDQRQHDVLAGLITAGVRSTGLASGELRSTADVTAVISLAELRSGYGAGWLEGVREPVSAATVGMLGCDAKFRLLVIGDAGEPLYLGKTQYPFSAAQRRALAVAQGGCVWDDCDVPASWCDIHHVVEYNAHGGRGKTDIDNAVLLCGEHHQFVHHSDWSVRMARGQPEVLAPFPLDPSQTWRPVTKSRLRLRDTG